MLTPAPSALLLREQPVWESPAWESKEHAHPMSPPHSGESPEKFAAQHRAWLLDIARPLCRGSVIDPEDLVQETLLRFVQKGQQNGLPPCEHWQAWLVRSLKNLFTDQYRRTQVVKRGAEDPLLSEESIVLPGPPAPSIYDSITAEQFDQALKEALSSMQRETFLLHMSGKKMAEIGRHLGIPEGTVRKRLHDSRLKLREHLLRYVPSGVH
jgi:RNA polymerase sigma-70 factor (ECF subfamily)